MPPVYVHDKVHTAAAEAAAPAAAPAAALAATPAGHPWIHGSISFNIIPPAGGRKYKLGALGAIGEPFANAFGNQRFVFVSFSFFFMMTRKETIMLGILSKSIVRRPRLDRRRLGNGKRFDFLCRILLKLIVFCPWPDRSRNSS